MKEKLADAVYGKIRDAIMTGELASDELIQEQRVADRYGISKITAREVLQRLCHDKYLKSFPRKGYLIVDLSPAQLNMLQKLRYQVEALALKDMSTGAVNVLLSQIEFNFRRIGTDELAIADEFQDKLRRTYGSFAGGCPRWAG